MKSIQIKLDNIEMLKRFVDDCRRFDAQIEVASGSVIADAKSIMNLMAGSDEATGTAHPRRRTEQRYNP